MLIANGLCRRSLAQRQCGARCSGHREERGVVTAAPPPWTPPARLVTRRVNQSDLSLPRYLHPEAAAVLASLSLSLILPFRDPCRLSGAVFLFIVPLNTYLEPYLRYPTAHDSRLFLSGYTSLDLVPLSSRPFQSTENRYHATCLQQGSCC